MASVKSQIQSVTAGLLQRSRWSGSAELLGHLKNRLDLTVEIGLIILLFLAPLFMGGRLPAGQLVYTILIIGVVLVWTVSKMLSPTVQWTVSGTEGWIFAAVSLVVFQLMPLPASWIATISSETPRLLSTWTTETEHGWGHWSQISLIPRETIAGLVILLGYAALLVVAIQYLRSIEQVERMLKWIGLSAAAIGIIGMLQYLGGNGKFLWVYEHPFRDTTGTVKGPFSNQNHFAHLLALGIGPLIWMVHKVLQRREQERSTNFSTAGSSDRTLTQYQLIGLLAGLVVMTFAGLLTFSRGGVLAILMAAAFCILFYFKYSLLGKKSLITLLSAGSVVLVALVIFGWSPLMSRLSSVSTGGGLIGADQQQAGRIDVWKADLQAVSRFPVLGTGVGSHREVNPIYFSKPTNVEYTHAESGYLHILVETGGLGLLIAAGVIFIVGRWCWFAWRQSSSPRMTACTIVVTGALLVSALHSIADFVWFIPACMVPTVLLAACACRLYLLSRPETETVERRFRLSFTSKIALLTFILGIGVVMITDRYRAASAACHWERFLRLSKMSADDETQGHATAESESMLISYLNRASKADPGRARVHLRLARSYLRLFELNQKNAENPMTLSQIRDAIVASQFPSRAAQDEWLARSVGKNRNVLDLAAKHARIALSLCPLQGEAYLFLSQVAFLDRLKPEVQQSLVDQAVQVRPYDGMVRYMAGRETIIAGDLPGAMEHWKVCFRLGPRFQKRVIQTLGPYVPAEVILGQFPWDLPSYQVLFRYYRENELDTHAGVVATHYGDALLDSLHEQPAGDDGARWLLAADVFYFLENHSQTLHCLRRAVESDKNSWEKRQALADALLEYSHYEEAAEQYEWCLRRTPDNQRIRANLKLAKLQTLKAGDPTTGIPSPVRIGATPESGQLR